ncbi:MAG TPA: NUDIX domain-containing protein [Cyclobacteriaceae bacterium]|nr:NUDIX domain-containing protein [Cyclobacteriaceae bacterium]
MNDQIPDLNKDFLEHGHETFLRHLSVDCVIFGFHENELKVLLLKWKDDGPWCVPGGFVRKEESLEESVDRVLKERTGLDNIFLRQFHVFSDPAREKKKDSFPYASKGGWLMERFISIGFYALVEFSKVSPEADAISEECRWWDVDSVPKMVFDHNEIFQKALHVLRMSLNDHPIGYELLPSKFTMPELQKLYETILGKPLDRRNFQKKMLALGILERQKERKTGGAHKAPYLYRFNKVKYDRALKLGLKGGF